MLWGQFQVVESSRNLLHQSPIRTAMYAYRPLLERWGVDVAKWVTVAKPAAELQLEAPSVAGNRAWFPEVPGGGKLTADGSGVVMDDEHQVHIFRTRFGARFARVVEPSGFVLWLKEVET